MHVPLRRRDVRVSRQFLDRPRGCPAHRQVRAERVTETMRPVPRHLRPRVLRFEGGNLGDHKAVGGGVLEARLMFGPGYRIYFAREGATLVLLLVGGSKATQVRDIRTAQRYWRDYLEEQ